MSRQKKHVLFAADHTFSALNLLSGAICKDLSVKISRCSLEDSVVFDDDLKEILSKNKNLYCVVFFTDLGLEKSRAKNIYKLWRGRLPDTDFIWCHASYDPDVNWFIGEDWGNTKWIDTDATNQAALYQRLIKQLKSVLNTRVGELYI